EEAHARKHSQRLALTDAGHRQRDARRSCSHRHVHHRRLRQRMELRLASPWAGVVAAQAASSLASANSRILAPHAEPGMIGSRLRWVRTSKGGVMRAKINGIGMTYEVSGRTDAPAVVLHHPLATNLSTWDALTAALEPTYRVIRMDARGHGKTEAPD